MAEVVLLSRADCHLCEEARAVLERVVGTSYGIRDVDADPELRAEYGDRVPVVLLDGREHAYFTVDEARLRRALAED